MPREREASSRDLWIVTSAWALLALMALWLGRQHVALPGLYYDEAIFGGLAKEFVVGHARDAHMPGTKAIEWMGRPFPLFVQPYLGALKTWLLIPSFQVFGTSLAVLRLTNVAWSLAGLLLFMLWVWRMAGRWEALIAGALLALDPAFFFLAHLDWGAAVPSFVCRFAGFLFATLAWQRRQASFAGLAGLCFGLGFFNKIDFAVILIGVGLAAVCAAARPLAELLRTRPRWAWSGAVGLLLGAGPMLGEFAAILRPRLRALSNPGAAATGPSEWSEKFEALSATFDGSYFHRLMDAGGVFARMPEADAGGWTPLGIVTLAAGVVVAIHLVRQRGSDPVRTFVLASAVFVLAGIVLLPGAVRVHHTTLLYPFPQLLITLAGSMLWRRAWRTAAWQRAVRGGLLAGLLALLLAQVHAISRTEALVRETRGRGWWSDALVAFSREVKDRSDLTIVSLDWGFNEPLVFLTDAPRLEELFYRLTAARDKVSLPRDPNAVYLAYAPEYLAGFDNGLLSAVSRQKSGVEIRPWRDGEGRVVFYSFRFVAPGG